MKNKTFISMLAFLTVCVLVLVLCFSGVSVFASDPINLVSTYGVPEDPIVNYDTYTCFLDPLGDSNIKQSYQDNYNNNFEFVYSGYDSYFSNYICYGNSNNYSIEFQFYTPNTFVCVDDSSCYIYSSSTDCDYVQDNYSGQGFYCAFYSDETFYATSNWYINNNNLDNEYTIDGATYYRGYGGFNICNSSMPIYYVSDAANVTTLSGAEQINPSGGGGGGETSINNLFLNDGYFIFSTPESGYFAQLPLSGYVDPNQSNWFNGTITFNYQLTEYQLAHPDEFLLRFTVHVDYYVGSYLGGAQTDLRYYGFHDPAPGQVQDIQVSTLTDRTTYTFKINDFMVAFKQWYSDLSVDLSDKTIKVDDAVFTLRIGVQVVDSQDHTGTDTTDTLNFINNTVKSNSAGVTNNNYPYTEGNSGSDLPAPTDNGYINQTGNGTLPSGTGTSGNIIVNNTNYNNRLIDPKPVVDYTKNEMLPNENDTNYVGLLEEQTHEDGFINFLSTTFSFVPTAVWTSLSHYFTILLTMIVAFFGLRLILDIL